MEENSNAHASLNRKKVCASFDLHSSQQQLKNNYDSATTFLLLNISIREWTI